MNRERKLTTSLTTTNLKTPTQPDKPSIGGIEDISKKLDSIGYIYTEYNVLTWLSTYMTFRKYFKRSF